MRGLAQGGQVQAAGVVSTNDHGEGIFKAQRLRDGDVVARGVEAADGVENGLGIPIDGLLEDRGEGRAGVFDVGVDAAGDERLMADVTAGEIEAAFNFEIGLGFDLLSEEFTEDYLLGEVFCADDGVVGARGRAGGQQQTGRECC